MHVSTNTQSHIVCYCQTIITGPGSGKMQACGRELPAGSDMLIAWQAVLRRAKSSQLGVPISKHVNSCIALSKVIIIITGDSTHKGQTLTSFTTKSCESSITSTACLIQTISSVVTFSSGCTKRLTICTGMHKL